MSAAVTRAANSRPSISATRAGSSRATTESHHMLIVPHEQRLLAAANEGVAASQPASAKRIATLQARLALRGLVLVQGAGGDGWWVSQAGSSRRLADLGAVETFANNVEAAAS